MDTIPPTTPTATVAASSEVAQSEDGNQSVAEKPADAGVEEGSKSTTTSETTQSETLATSATPSDMATTSATPSEAPPTDTPATSATPSEATPSEAPPSEAPTAPSTTAVSLETAEPSETAEKSLEKTEGGESPDKAVAATEPEKMDVDTPQGVTEAGDKEDVAEVAGPSEEKDAKVADENSLKLLPFPFHAGE